MNKVKTRFAPSPTGLMHIGSVRTALYAFLVARKNQGNFLLRIEDTDRTRLVPGSVEDILENLKWLGLNYDEGPIVQSERKDLYQKYANELVEKGVAYKEEGAIWFKVPAEGVISFTDLIGNRKIEFENKSQKDFVILKSDGFPTYHLAHVVDDHLLEISPVIRAEEWLPSTPKHIMLFQALGWEVPQYAHLPLILGTDRSKLSKRHGAKGTSEFRKDGFLPEAILNYMVLLGWTPKGDREFLSLEEMINEFSLEEVHVAPAVFDITKLEWMNGKYIRNLSDEELAQKLEDFLVDHPAKEKIAKLVPLVKERINKLSDFIPLTNFIFEKPEYDIEKFNKLKLGEVSGGVKGVLEMILQKMETLEKPWGSYEFEQTFRKLAEELNIPVGSMFQLIRISISGQTVTPPLFETIEIMGEEEAINRVKDLIAKYPKV